MEAVGVLSLTAPEPVTINCRLLDISPHGFRAAHDYAGLAAGVEVRLQSAVTGEMVARVIWTAIVNAHIESGFYIVGSQRLIP